MRDTKFGGQISFKVEPEAAAKFIANAEACKSTKDIVLRELVYAFNRYCEAEGGRFPVLQRLEVVAPGYRVQVDRVEDASTPYMVMLPDVGQPGAPVPSLPKKSPAKAGRPKAG